MGVRYVRSSEVVKLINIGELGLNPNEELDLNLVYCMIGIEE